MSTTAPKNNISVSRLLNADLVVIGPPYREKDTLVEFLVKKLCSIKAIKNASTLSQKVFEREKGISTTLDTGLSLMHARVKGISEIAAILCLLPQAIVDPQQHDVPIRAVFLFVSPDSKEMFAPHLQLLRSIASLFKPDFIDELLKIKTPAQAFDLIRRRESAPKTSSGQLSSENVSEGAPKTSSGQPSSHDVCEGAG